MPGTNVSFLVHGRIVTNGSIGSSLASDLDIMEELNGDLKDDCQIAIRKTLPGKYMTRRKL